MVYVFLAEGFEELEAVSVIDILRRGNIEVVTVGVGGRDVRGAHGIDFAADICSCKAQYDGLEMMVLPGGMPGTNNLRDNETVNAFIDHCMENNIPVAAICAAPIILGGKGLLNGRQAVCYPGMEARLIGAKISSSPVVQDGNIITSKGPGTASQFGLYLLEKLAGKETADGVRAGMLF